MNIKIRSERVSDYSGIACVNYEAFLGWHPDNPYVSEPLMVDLLRHNDLFDPDLSLVAEREGKVVGHILFSPFRFIVLGQEQPGVILGPVSVYPEYQNTGIGKMLIEEGHRRAAEKGFAFSMLCGHPRYYPRFGYRQEMFSVTGIKVNIDIDDFNYKAYEERPVKAHDLPWITACWEREHGSDSLAIFPGTDICGWSNHSPGSRCSVILREGRVIGYIRYVKSNPLGVKTLLALHKDITGMLAFLLWEHHGEARGEVRLTLPVETTGAKMAGLPGIRVVDERVAYDAFMIKVLDGHNSVVEEYCRQVEEGIIKPGIIVFPPMFDVDDGRVE